MTANPDQLLTYPQTAQRLGVSTRDVQRMVGTEQVGFVLDARGRRRIPASSLAGRLA